MLPPRVHCCVHISVPKCCLLLTFNATILKAIINLFWCYSCKIFNKSTCRDDRIIIAINATQHEIRMKIDPLWVVRRRSSRQPTVLALSSECSDCKHVVSYICGRKKNEHIEFSFDVVWWLVCLRFSNKKSILGVNDSKKTLKLNWK